MPNISKKTAYDVKEASNQSLTASARKNYAKDAQAGMKDDSPMSMYCLLYTSPSPRDS